MLLRIHHTAIICADYDRSKQFYTEILGLKIIAENYHAIAIPINWILPSPTAHKLNFSPFLIDPRDLLAPKLVACVI